MLTIFGVPKPFYGHIAVIQHNALDSWAALEPPCELVLFGDEPGVAEAAARVRARHEPLIGSTASGIPRVDELFRRARATARFDVLCFANADILLPPSLTPAVTRVAERFDRFVAIGRCRNVDLAERVAVPNWSRLLTDGEMRPPGGIDYLVFSRDVYETIPPFALGRAGFDNWLVWEARRLRIPVVDLTDVVVAIHQNHDYGHLAGGRDTAYAGPDARRNIELAGGELRLFNIDDADFRLGVDGIRRRPIAAVRAVPIVRWLGLRRGELRRALRARLGERRGRPSRPEME